MAGNFDKKRMSYGAAKGKPPEEFSRELLIWVLNGIHMANLRGKDTARVTLAIEPLLRVGALERAETVLPYITEVLERYQCKIVKLTPKPKNAGAERFKVLEILVSNILKCRIKRVEERYRKEVKLRAAFEGVARTRAKMATDFRAQNR